MFVGVVLLALPQVPLTLGNAVIAPVEFNNREFPDRPVTERQVAISTGIMNTLGSLIGAVPMCHGAGGMAAQVSFGARTGGAPVILGVLLIVLALFFSDSIATLLRLFPQPALGVMLFLAGVQLALGSCDFSQGQGRALRDARHRGAVGVERRRGVRVRRRACSGSCAAAGCGCEVHRRPHLT